MNYLQRLIKRALAQPNSSYRDQLSDPFRQTENEESQWPQLKTAVEPKHIETNTSEKFITNTIERE